MIRNNFTDVPLVLGEFDASSTNTEPAARWKYHDQIAKAAAQFDIATVLWDNGLDHLDRTASKWRDPTSIDILTKTTESTANSLPDSTVDASATSQSSSAYIFHKVGTSVTTQTLPFILNGNTVESIKESSGTTLSKGSDYSVSGSNIVFSTSYLSKHFSSSTSPGVIATLTVKFSGGVASPTIQLVQWDKPTLSSTSASASSVSGSDLSIPVTWKGLSKLATVKAVTSSGKYLFDDWTQYLGPLQQARAVSASLHFVPYYQFTPPGCF